MGTSPPPMDSSGLHTRHRGLLARAALGSCVWMQMSATAFLGDMFAMHEVHQCGAPHHPYGSSSSKVCRGGAYGKGMQQCSWPMHGVSMGEGPMREHL